MNLYEFWGKRVKITDTDGKIFIGYAAYYTSALDDPDGVGYLSLEPDGREDILIDFTENEITNIEINPPVLNTTLARAV